VIPFSKKKKKEQVENISNNAHSLTLGFPDTRHRQMAQATYDQTTVASYLQHVFRAAPVRSRQAVLRRAAFCRRHLNMQLLLVLPRDLGTVLEGALGVPTGKNPSELDPATVEVMQSALHSNQSS
jgi:hypothetical protein